MSETFRHTTMLIAIRDAGFVCDDVAAAHRTGEGTWTVSCADMQGYSVSVAAGGELSVTPVPHYFDLLQPALRLESQQTLDPRRVIP